MESFFSLLQKNVLPGNDGTPGPKLRLAIVTWIERSYHRKRHECALGRHLERPNARTIWKSQTASQTLHSCRVFRRAVSAARGCRGVVVESRVK